MSRTSAAFRESLVLLGSASMALFGVLAALLLWVIRGNSAEWVYPLLGALVGSASWLAASRKRTLLAAQILTYGFALVIAAVLVLGQDPVLLVAAKLALAPLIALFSFVAPRREALTFDGIAIALLAATPMLRKTPVDELAAALGASVLEAAALGVFAVIVSLSARRLEDSEDALTSRLTELDGVLTQANRIAKGDLRGEMAGHHEAAMVMQAMLDGLRRLVDQVQSGVQILGSSTNQIAAMSMEQERGAVHQASAVAETRETIESFAESSRRIADSARGVLDNAERTLKNSELASERINALTNHTRRINELLEFIKEVANKSDLLALNAALEGTKAGEAGRGFSLVAAQMQRLAESTMETVKDVKSLIVDITSATNATVLSMEQATKLAADTTRAAREISLITQQQGSSAEQVVEAMKDIATVTNEFAGGSKDTMNAIEEIKRLAERLHRVAHRFALPEHRESELHPSLGPTSIEVDDVAVDAAN